MIAYSIRSSNVISSFDTFSDEYVPLRVKFCGGRSPARWLRFKSDYSLLEIGLSDENLISEIVLIQVEDLVGEELFSMPNVSGKFGLPFVDFCPDDCNFVDVRSSVKANVVDGGLFVMVSDRVASDLIVNGSIKFAVAADGSLCWIGVSALGKKQVDVIRRAVEGNLSRGFLN
jgi:hypothetical protein